MLKLHAVKHTNKSRCWCGPAALSAVTGMDTASTTALIRSVAGRATIKGTSVREMCLALARLGVSARPESVSGSPTLVRWARENRAKLATEPVVVLAGNHYVAMQGQRFADSHVHEPTRFSVCPHRRKRVETVIRLAAPGGITKWSAPPKPPVVRTPAGLLARAKQAGITIEQHLNNPGEYWVWPPRGFPESRDPYESEGHLAYDLHERTTRIQTYLTLIQP